MHNNSNKILNYATEFQVSPHFLFYDHTPNYYLLPNRYISTILLSLK